MLEKKNVSARVKTFIFFHPQEAHMNNQQVKWLVEAAAKFTAEAAERDVLPPWLTCAESIDQMADELKLIARQVREVGHHTGQESNN